MYKKILASIITIAAIIVPSTSFAIYNVQLQSTTTNFLNTTWLIPPTFNTVQQILVSPYFFATSTTIASTFPYASTTALTVSGSSYLGTVRSGAWNGTAISFGFGGTGLSSAADDTVMVSSGAAWVASAIPNCTDTGGNHLNYTIASNAFSCGTSSSGGGGGSSGGTFSTTTSTVAGELVNYPNNSTDVVNIGSNSTTTGAFWFDPNISTGYVRGSLGIGTTTPYSMLSVAGQVVGQNFVATSTTGVSYFMGTVGIGTSNPVQVNANAKLTVAGIGSQDYIASTTDNTTSSDAIYNAYAPGSRIFIGAHGTNQVSTIYGITSGGYGELAAIDSSMGTNNGLIIGTRTTATPIIFGTNNVERMRILSNGNVGIGTSSPYTALSVNGQTVALNYIATSTAQSSIFPYASTTMITSTLVYKMGAFTIATTTAWAGTTTEQQLFTPMQAETWISATCNTFPAGSTVNVQFFNNSAKMNMIAANATPAITTLSTNNSIAALATTTFMIGTPASSPTSVECTIKRLAPAN